MKILVIVLVNHFLTSTMKIDQTFIALPDGNIENKNCYMKPKPCNVHCAAFDVSEHGRAHLYCMGEHRRPVTVRWKGEPDPIPFFEQEHLKAAVQKLIDSNERRAKRLENKQKKLAREKEKQVK